MFPILINNKAKLLADTINKHSKFYGIDTKEKLQHFLAQAGVETDNFKSFKEYTTFRPKIVMEKFEDYFNDLGQDDMYPNRKNLSSIYTSGAK